MQLPYRLVQSVTNAVGTRYKYKYVRWEAEVAIEKGCTIIGVNLDQARQIVERTSLALTLTTAALADQASRLEVESRRHLAPLMTDPFRL